MSTCLITASTFPLVVEEIAGVGNVEGGSAREGCGCIVWAPSVGDEITARAGEFGLLPLVVDESVSLIVDIRGRTDIGNY